MFTRGPILVIGVTAAILLVSPYGLGMLAESNIRERVAIMDRNPNLSVAVTSHESGWFQSRATVEVTPSGFYAQALAAQDPEFEAVFANFRLPFVVELGHGPILTLNGFGIGSYAVRATLDSETEWVASAMSALDAPHLIELRGRAGFLTGFDFEGDVPPFEVNDGDATLTFAGLMFSGHTNGTDLSFDASSEHFVVQAPLMSLTLEGLGATGDYELRPGTVSLGEAEISVDRFTVINPLLGADDLFAASGFGLSGYSRLNDNENIDFGATYRADSLAALASPEFSDIAVGINMANLSSSAYERLYGMADQLQTTSDPAILALQMLPIINDFIAAGPSISLDPVRFSMDGGDFDARIEVTVVPSGLPPGGLMNLMNPSTLLSAFTGELELESSRPLLQELVSLGLEEQMGAQLNGLSEDEIDTIMAQQAEQAIAFAVAQGMLVDNGATYSTIVDYRDGVATVNGNPLPLEALGLF